MTATGLVVSAGDGAARPTCRRRGRGFFPLMRSKRVRLARTPISRAETETIVGGGSTSWCGRPLQRRSGGVARKDSLELGAGADAELEEHLAQVVLDRARLMNSWALISGFVSLSRASRAIWASCAATGTIKRPELR